ncbi:MAG: S-layer homology domain-containing protein [Armatimonadetes bacterium]|nr:S-layer homology domain-containing protein [Armatimonadota bacterium]
MNRTLKFALGVALSVGLVMPAAAQSNFPDVPDNHWAYEALANLKGSVLFGYPDGLYRPSRPMSRAEFAVAINNLYSLAMGKMAGLSDQLNALDAYVKGMKTGATEEQMAELQAQINAIKTSIPDVSSMRADIASMKRLAGEFEKEMASFGVDMDAMKRDMADLENRVSGLEGPGDRVNLSGDLIFVGLAGHSTDGMLGLTKTGRVTGEVGGNPVGMDRTFQVYHNLNITLDGDAGNGAAWKASINSSNAYGDFGFGLFANWNGSLMGEGYGQRGPEDMWVDEANITFATDWIGQDADMTVGRFYHSSGPFFLARPHYAEFYDNPRTNNGKHVLDGIRSVFGFGSADLTVLLARVDDFINSGGVPWTGMMGETLFGLELDFDLGGSGTLKGVHYWEQSNTIGAFGVAGEDRMRTFGAQVEFDFDNFGVYGVFSQTDFYLGDASVLNSDNTATVVGLSYEPGGNWGASAYYGMIEGNFGAEGSWGRVGPYFNPANVDVVGAHLWLDVGNDVRLSGGWRRFEPAESAAMGAFGIMMGNDDLTAFEVGVAFDLNSNWTANLGWENIDGSMLSAQQVDFNWYSIDLNYAVSDNADVAIHYLFSDGMMPLNSGTFSGTSVWKGGILGVQATVRF